jgi:hypothetical protein
MNLFKTLALVALVGAGVVVNVIHYPNRLACYSKIRSEKK